MKGGEKYEKNICNNSSRWRSICCQYSCSKCRRDGESNMGSAQVHV